MEIGVIFFAVVIGTLYAGVALGLTMTFGLLGTINFAHGQMMMLGGYLTFWATTTLGIHFWLGLALAVLGVGLLGFVIERTTFRFAREAPINGLIMSLGLALIIQNIVLAYWQSTPRTIQPPVTTVLQFSGIAVPTQGIVTIVVVGSLIGAFIGFLRYTRIGSGIRATGINRLAAESVGIDTGNCATLSFVIGASLAGAVGALWGALFVVTPTMGDDPLVKGFVVVVLGGLGSVPGAVAGGLTIALIETIGVSLTSATYAPAFAFASMLFVLLVRPQGLFAGRRSA